MEGLIDTRNEYIEHIQDILSVAISKRIYALYTETIEEKKGIKGFQNELYSIRKWNNNIVSDEYKNIVKYTKCKYISNLIKIIIITTIKIKIYEYKEQFDSIKIKIPNPEDFVHKCYINAASFSWKNAYLYNRNNIKDAEYQNNLNIIEENIRAIIKKTFRDFIPFDEIFNQIEDNLTENVNQYKETGVNENVKIIKGPKKDNDEEEDDEEDEEDDEEDDEDEEDEEDEDEEEEDDKEDEEDDEDDDEEDEEDNKNDDKVNNDKEDEEEDDEEDDKQDEEDDDDDDKEDEEEDEKEEVNDNEDESRIEDNKKINENNIVDTSIKKISDDEYKGWDKNEENNKEISFAQSEQTNMQTKEHADEKENNNVRNEWDNIKVEYNSLSQNNGDNKRYKNEIASKKYEEDNDDAKSVFSVATDISQVKKIHINETLNRNKRPSFF
jgi:hypothetical protein